MRIRTSSLKQPAYLLIECLVYIGVLFVILGAGYLALTAALIIRWYCDAMRMTLPKPCMRENVGGPMCALPTAILKL